MTEPILIHSRQVKHETIYGQAAVEIASGPCLEVIESSSGFGQALLAKLRSQLRQPGAKVQVGQARGLHVGFQEVKVSQNSKEDFGLPVKMFRLPFVQPACCLLGRLRVSKIVSAGFQQPQHFFTMFTILREINGKCFA
jgi:hypothetical protein